MKQLTLRLFLASAIFTTISFTIIALFSQCEKPDFDYLCKGKGSHSQDSTWTQPKSSKYVIDSQGDTINCSCQPVKTN